MTQRSENVHTVQVWLIGDFRHREFRSAQRWLRGRRQCSLTAAERFETAAARLELGAAPPDAIIFAQPRPGQFSQDQVERVRAAVPMARLLLLQGGWCEGEHRADRRLQGVVSAHWTQWRSYASRAIEVSAAANSWPWALPKTSTPAERFLEESRAPLPGGSGVISIWTDSRDTFSALAAACDAAGYSAAWARLPHTVVGATGAVWDGDLQQSRQADALRSLADESSPAPVVALVNFPRAEDLAAAASLGAASVLARPYRIAEMLAELRRLTAAVQPVSRQRAA